MLGSYQLEYERQTYFGNVTLREFHIFGYGDHIYLANVEAMTAFSVSPRMADLIRVIAVTPGSLIPVAFVQELRKLQLIPEGEVPVEGSRPDRSRRECSVTNITLLIAQRCNMRCVYCYGDGGEYGEKGMMSLETAFQAVDWLIDISGSAEHLNICFFGGEPLLNFAVMKEVVPYAREKGEEKGKRFTFSVTTNGSLLNDEIISFIKDEDIRPMISFDGPPEYQNRNRPFRNGRGSYDRIYANIQRLRVALPYLGARAIVCGDADPFRVKASAAEAGFSTCSLGSASPVILKPRQDSQSVDGNCRERALERMLSYKRQLIDELIEVIRERKVNIQCPPTLLHAITNMCAGKRHYYGCGMGRGLAGISIAGDIYPCHRFIGQPEMRMGNIADYKAEGLNDYSRAIVEHLPVCQSCWARYWCGGGCFYRNKAFTGDLHRPDSLDCRERKAHIEGLIHVQQQLNDDDKEYLQRVREEILMSRGLQP
jgi:uncharacterized protein